MIELLCEVHGTSKHGWTQLSAVIPPSAVHHWCRRFHADDAVYAMWQLAAEVMEATYGRKYWVQEIGNAIEMTWEMKSGLTDRHVIIPTPAGPELVKLVIDVPNGAVRQPSVGGRA